MNFIEVRSYDNYIEAHLMLGRLRDEFINCHLLNENSVTIDPFLSNAIGGIKLMVADSQLERALEIITETEKRNTD
jgi:Putative prokaryotic signal transducing protein